MKKQGHNQMLRLYEQWQASGESKVDFAVSCGIRPSTFYYWARKFEQSNIAMGQTGLSPASGFHHISIEGSSHNNQGELIAAIDYPSGIRLKLYSSFQVLSNSYVQLLKTLTE